MNIYEFRILILAVYDKPCSKEEIYKVKAQSIFEATAKATAKIVTDYNWSGNVGLIDTSLVKRDGVIIDFYKEVFLKDL
jgi:hypothetical protein